MLRDNIWANGKRHMYMDGKKKQFLVQIFNDFTFVTTDLK